MFQILPLGYWSLHKRKRISFVCHTMWHISILMHPATSIYLRSSSNPCRGDVIVDNVLLLPIGPMPTSLFCNDGSITKYDIPPYFIVFLLFIRNLNRCLLFWFLMEWTFETKMMTTDYPYLCQFYSTLTFSLAFSCKYHHRQLLQKRLYIECDNTPDESCTEPEEEDYKIWWEGQTINSSVYAGISFS